MNYCHNESGNESAIEGAKMRHAGKNASAPGNVSFLGVYLIGNLCMSSICPPIQVVVIMKSFVLLEKLLVKRKYAGAGSQQP